MATYRTRTYIAGDWDNDKDAVDQLHKWNDSNYWSLSFTDAHDLTSSRDSSLNCTIKSSLKTRMDASKTFVLIVGDHTASVTAGGCQLCGSYNSYTKHCAKGYSVDYRSFIKFECDKAIPKSCILRISSVCPMPFSMRIVRMFLPISIVSCFIFCSDIFYS